MKRWFASMPSGAGSLRTESPRCGPSLTRPLRGSSIGRSGVESGISARPAESFAKIMTILVHNKHVYRICYWEHFISFPQRLVFMGVGFNHERRDLLKSTWTSGDAAAAISAWGSRHAL